MSGCSKEKLWDISTVIVLWFENLEQHLNHWFTARVLRLMGSCLAVCNRPAMFNVKCIQLNTKLYTSAGSRSRHILNIASATPFFCQQSPKCWFWLFRHERITRSLCKLDQRPSLWIRSFKKQALAPTVSSFDTRMLQTQSHKPYTYFFQIWGAFKQSPFKKNMYINMYMYIYIYYIYIRCAFPIISPLK